jgi:hypothetical protein
VLAADTPSCRAKRERGKMGRNCLKSEGLRGPKVADTPSLRSKKIVPITSSYVSFRSEPFNGLLIPCRRALRMNKKLFKVGFGALRALGRCPIPRFGACVFYAWGLKVGLRAFGLDSWTCISPRRALVLGDGSCQSRFRIARRHGMSCQSVGSEDKEGWSQLQFKAGRQYERYYSPVFAIRIVRISLNSNK